MDEVYAAEGKTAWCDPYDYSQDGTVRLKEQISQEQPTATVQAARLWQEVTEIVGEQKIGQLFDVWGKAGVDPTDPGAALRAALLTTFDQEGVEDWWNRFEPIMIFSQPRSGFKTRTLSNQELINQPMELAHDDGKSTGNRSIAGDDHAGTFQASAPQWYLIAVRIYGSRYGYPKAPKENYHVWLCDDQGNVVPNLTFAYSTFRRGEAHWVNLRVEPTDVPAGFVICVGFNPTVTKGVYVHHDGNGQDHSRFGLPGKLSGVHGRGEWMIRAVLDQPKAANSLKVAE